VIEEWREASDGRQRKPTRSEGADFGEGDSTGVQDLNWSCCMWSIIFTLKICW